MIFESSVCGEKTQCFNQAILYGAGKNRGVLGLSLSLYAWHRSKRADGAGSKMVTTNDHVHGRCKRSLGLIFPFLL